MGRNLYAKGRLLMDEGSLEQIAMARLAIDRSGNNKRAREILERLDPIDTTEL